MLKNFTRTEEESGKDEVKVVDPLRWYGLLAHQSLKDAQSRFVKGTKSDDCLMVVLEESIEVANAMAKLRTSESAILELRKKQNPNSTHGQLSTMESLPHTEKRPLDDMSETESVQAQEDIKYEDFEK